MLRRNLPGVPGKPRIFYMKKEITPFRVKQADLNHVRKTMQELKRFCNLKKIPMFICVAVENGDDGTKYENEAVLASTGYTLEENRIASLLLMTNGFDVELPPEIRRDVEELQGYLSMIRTAEDGSVRFPSAGKTLAEDRIVRAAGVAERGDRVAVPHSHGKGDPYQGLEDC